MSQIKRASQCRSKPEASSNRTTENVLHVDRIALFDERAVKNGVQYVTRF